MDIDSDIREEESLASKRLSESKISDLDKNAQDNKISAERAKAKADKERKLGHRRVGEGGEITYKKIQTSQIMGSIQLGIQHTVGSLASKPKRDLLMMDFWEIESIIFPPEGSTLTPAHHFVEFRFKIYAPIAFRYFRDLFGIRPDDFMMSMCSASLRELSNPGASGSIFYLTNDDEFIIKTVQHKEGEFLQKLLPGYYMNLNQNPRTLLPKFFGLYCFQCNAKNVRLVVMNNLLPSSVKMHLKYDLKGSTYKRKASKSERNKSSPTYKDLDFMEHHPNGILLESETYSALIRTIQRDCTVLESFKIMDYSLLVGVHNLDLALKEKQEKPQQSKQGQQQQAHHSQSKGNYPKLEDDIEDAPEADQCIAQDVRARARTLNRNKSFNRQRLVAHSTAMESIQAESEPIDEEDDVPPGGIPARSEKGERLLLFIGIIDILQSYRLKKKLEHTVKSIIHDGDTVSVHRPSFYAQRFQNFMAKTVFKKIPSLDLPEIKGTHKKFRTLVSSYIALKHSPSKRKSISKLIQNQNQNTTGEKDTNGVAPKPAVAKPVTSNPPSSNQTRAKTQEKSRIKVPPPVPPRGSPKLPTDAHHETKVRIKDAFNAKGSSNPSYSNKSNDSQDDIQNKSPENRSSSRSNIQLSPANARSDPIQIPEPSSQYSLVMSTYSSKASIEDSTSTWTEGTPSLTESSSSDYSASQVFIHSDRKSTDDALNSLTTEMVTNYEAQKFYKGSYYNQSKEYTSGEKVLL